MDKKPVSCVLIITQSEYPDQQLVYQSDCEEVIQRHLFPVFIWFSIEHTLLVIKRKMPQVIGLNLNLDPSFPFLRQSCSQS